MTQIIHKGNGFQNCHHKNPQSRKRNNPFFITMVMLLVCLCSCGKEETIMLEVSDGQISYVFQDSVYLIDDPLVIKRTDLFHSGPDVAAIEIKGAMSDSETFTIWVRNYVGEPSDCVLETTYYSQGGASESLNKCVEYGGESHCNAAGLTYNDGKASYGSNMGFISITKCSEFLISGTFESKPYFENGIFQNLRIME